MKNKRRIELDITHGFFGLGFSTPSREFTKEKYIAIIIGFLVIRFNI